MRLTSKSLLSGLLSHAAEAGMTHGTRPFGTGLEILRRLVWTWGFVVMEWEGISRIPVRRLPVLLMSHGVDWTFTSSLFM